jgi:hypothetical protein
VQRLFWSVYFVVSIALMAASLLSLWIERPSLKPPSVATPAKSSSPLLRKPRALFCLLPTWQPELVAGGRARLRSKSTGVA